MIGRCCVVLCCLLVFPWWWVGVGKKVLVYVFFGNLRLTYIVCYWVLYCFSLFVI